MSPQVQKTFDAAISDIMAQVAKLNEITCAKHKATSDFLLSVFQDSTIDHELRFYAGQLMGMYTIMHLAKHKCDDIAAAKGPTEVREIMEQIMKLWPD